MYFLKRYFLIILLIVPELAWSKIIQPSILVDDFSVIAEWELDGIKLTYKIYSNEPHRACMDDACQETYFEPFLVMEDALEGGGMLEIVEPQNMFDRYIFEYDFLDMIIVDVIRYDRLTKPYIGKKTVYVDLSFSGNGKWREKEFPRFSGDNRDYDKPRYVLYAEKDELVSNYWSERNPSNILKYMFDKALMYNDTIEFSVYSTNGINKGGFREDEKYSYQTSGGIQGPYRRGKVLQKYQVGFEGIDESIDNMEIRTIQKYESLLDLYLPEVNDSLNRQLKLARAVYGLMYFIVAFTALYILGFVIRKLVQLGKGTVGVSRNVSRDVSTIKDEVIDSFKRSNSMSKVDELGKLAKLYQDGLITQEEYLSMKTELLKS